MLPQWVTCEYRGEGSPPVDLNFLIDPPLPRNIRPTDIDLVFHAKGRLLAVEFKPEHAKLNAGQQRMYRDFAEQPILIVPAVARHDGKGNFTRLQFADGTVLEGKEEFKTYVEKFVRYYPC
jgi:hypothetical protein